MTQDDRLRLYSVIGLAAILAAIIAVARMDASPLRNSNLILPTIVWICLQFAIGAVLLYASPAIGAGYVALTALCATIAFGYACAVLFVFVGIGWGGSGPSLHDKLLFGSALFGFAACIALLTVVRRLALSFWRSPARMRLFLGSAVAFVCARVLSSFRIF